MHPNRLHHIIRIPKFSLNPSRCIFHKSEDSRVLILDFQQFNSYWFQLSASHSSSYTCGYKQDSSPWTMQQRDGDLQKRDSQWPRESWISWEDYIYFTDQTHKHFGELMKPYTVCVASAYVSSQLMGSGQQWWQSWDVTGRTHQLYIRALRMCVPSSVSLKLNHDLVLYCRHQPFVQTDQVNEFSMQLDIYPTACKWKSEHIRTDLRGTMEVCLSKMFSRFYELCLAMERADAAFSFICPFIFGGTATQFFANIWEIHFVLW